MIQYLYLGRVAYEDGLRLQSEIATSVAEGRLHNVLLLLEHPHVLTLGRNANRANVLMSNELLAARGISLHEINRGGDVTYHGPGQLVGYPIFDLRTLNNPNGGRMGPVDFVRGMEEVLIRVCAAYGVQAGRVPGLTGVWCGATDVVSGQGSETGGQGLATEGLGAEKHSAKSERKIAAIGIHVAKGITSHGFAFNVTTDLRQFQMIVPCGIANHGVTSLAEEIREPQVLPPLETVAHQAARQFGLVFDQQILAADSVEALRANSASRQFPAEDTPLRTPAEVERLSGAREQPVRA
ncbi:MAG: lipoyl(octanoyl) transferase LipB [Terracidiphilus sp.]